MSTEQHGPITLHHGDCLDVLRGLPDASVDAVVCDPPYGLANTSSEQVADTLVRWVNGDRDYIPSGAGFMGKSWDAFVPPVAVWDECFRVLKPGGHLLAFAGSRTFDLMALSVRLAGFEVRDSLAWLYGSGFPKSLDVSKALDKAAGAEREVVGIGGKSGKTRGSMAGDFAGEWSATAPATADAARWQGWGTALKPAFEPVVVARKPLSGTVAQTVLAHGTGALNIDGCRVEGTKGWPATRRYSPGQMAGGLGDLGGEKVETVNANPDGRWPANVVLDEDQAAELDEQSGDLAAGNQPRIRNADENRTAYGDFVGQDDLEHRRMDAGGASRFFYVAKADSSERVRIDGTAHPTVKPLSLMRWLVRLVTPPGGTVLEPFAGSGTTAEACLLEGFACIAIEREADYLPLIRQRLNRRRDPVEAVKASGDDGGLFDLLDGGAA